MLGDQEVVSVIEYMSEYVISCVPNFLATVHEVIEHSYTSPVVTIRLNQFFGKYALCTMKIGGF